MKKKTIKLLFIDPSNIQDVADVLKILGDLPILVIFEYGAHPAYIVDTGIEVNKK